MDKKMTTREILLTASPLKLIISLSLPAIIGMMVADAMGAVSVAYPFTLINSGIATLLGVGSASVLSRAIGQKD